MTSRIVPPVRQRKPVERQPVGGVPHGATSEESRRRRFLYVCHRVPYPPDKGDRIRSWHFLKHLARLGQVDLAFLADEPLPAATLEVLESLCVRVRWLDISGMTRWIRGGLSLLAGRSVSEGLFFSRAFDATIRRWLDTTHYDTIVCYSSAMLPYVQRPGVMYRIVADLADVDSQKWLDYARESRWPLSWLFRWEAGRVRRLEREAAASRSVVLTTQREADLYRTIAPQASVQVVTNGIDLDYFSPVSSSGCSSVPPGARRCVFVGYLNYRANVLGLNWFCHEVWPLVRTQHPAAEFQIIGRHPTPAVLRLQEVPGVTVLQNVADVRPYLAEAGGVVVPLQVARGIQNKVLEAMAMGRPVVASPAALEGIGAIPGRDVLRADTPREWLETLTRVWRNSELSGAMGRCARQFVEMHHDWQTCLQSLTSLAVVPRDGHE